MENAGRLKKWLHTGKQPVVVRDNAVELRVVVLAAPEVDSWAGNPAPRLASPHENGDTCLAQWWATIEFYDAYEHERKRPISFFNPSRC